MAHADASIIDTDTETDVRVYEFCILYPYPFSQKEEQELLKGIEEIFSEAGGKLKMKDMWGRRGLAYRISGFSEGNYVVYYYELDPSKVKEIDQALKILKGVLRYLVVKPPKNYQIGSYAEKYVKWQEDSKLEVERKAQESEDKKLKQVVDKAKRVKTPVAKAETPVAPSKPVSEETLNKELDKLISDGDLNI